MDYSLFEVLQREDIAKLLPTNSMETTFFLTKIPPKVWTLDSYIIIIIINDFARYSNSIQITPAGLGQNVLLTGIIIVVETFHFKSLFRL